MRARGLRRSHRLASFITGFVVAFTWYSFVHSISCSVGLQLRIQFRARSVVNTYSNGVQSEGCGRGSRPLHPSGAGSASGSRLLPLRVPQLLLHSYFSCYRTRAPLVPHSYRCDTPLVLWSCIGRASVGCAHILLQTKEPWRAQKTGRDVQASRSEIGRGDCPTSCPPSVRLFIRAASVPRPCICPPFVRPFVRAASALRPPSVRVTVQLDVRVDVRAASV